MTDITRTDEQIGKDWKRRKGLERKEEREAEEDEEEEEKK